MNKETIYREDAINAINLLARIPHDVASAYYADMSINAICSLPSADRPRGEWILECDAEGEGDNLYRCSECGCNYGCQEYDIPNFCPNCGAKMKGAEDGTC